MQNKQSTVSETISFKNSIQLYITASNVELKQQLYPNTFFLNMPRGYWDITISQYPRVGYWDIPRGEKWDITMSHFADI